MLKYPFTLKLFTKRFGLHYKLIYLCNVITSSIV